MKTKKEESQESDEAATAQNTEIAPAAEAVSDENFSSELNEPLWSVISFEKLEAKNLTYDEAAQKLKKFAAEGVSGLCIVTDEAAAKISNKTKENLQG